MTYPNEPANQSQSLLPFGKICLWLTSLTLFLLLAYQIYTEGSHGMLHQWDDALAKSLNQWIYNHNDPLLNQLILWVTKLGSRWILIVLSVIIFSILAFKQNLKAGLLLFATTAGGPYLNEFVKLYIGRIRPIVEHPLVIHEAGNSFPSGHTIAATCFYGTLIYLVWKLLPQLNRSYKLVVSSWLFDITLLVMFSRLYLGVHFLSDVIGGMVLGIWWICTCVFWYEA